MENIRKEVDVQLENVEKINKRLDELLNELLGIQAMADNICVELETFKKGA
ncbi:MAG: hypothetical protein IJ963_05765 [Phascolarctobacterium sp.]|nr:hypothetical protein [Phascolarctobacterium sp.]MBR6636902.1 hypothetical protein [Phascolarctobacterium sp.]